MGFAKSGPATSSEAAGQPQEKRIPGVIASILPTTQADRLAAITLAKATSAARAVTAKVLQQRREKLFVPFELLCSSRPADGFAQRN